MSPRAGARAGAVRAGALVALLLLTGCGGGAGAASSPVVASSPAAVGPLPSGPLLTTDDLDDLLPGLSADASLRPRWEVREELWELQLLRARCGTDAASPAAAALTSSSSGSDAVEHDAEQWWQGTSPQYATLVVLRWPGGEPRGPESWRDDVVAAASECQEALVLPHQPGLDGGGDAVVVVRRWEGPTTGGGPGMSPLPLWQVGGFAVDGSTALVVRVGAYSAPTARAAWELAEPGVPALLARASQRAGASPSS